MKNITGKAGEMVIVIPKATWSGESGKVLKNILAQPQLALPQDEPIFDLIDVPPKAFKDIFKSTRNILTVKISPTYSKPVIEYKNDVWAHPQAIVHLKAKNDEQFQKFFTENSDKIIAYFLKAEKERQMGNYKKYHDKAVFNTISKNFEFNLKLPPGFKVTKKTDDFAWIRYETPEISQGITIKTIKYESDSTFTPDFLLKEHVKYWKENVPGPREGSFMTIEDRIEPVFNIFKHNGNYACEMRGLWRVENDFMGGPYVSLAVLDASKNRVVIIDGFVYAPRYDKRNYLRQVEAMIYSLEFPHQAKNDKINSQVNMSNL